MKTANFICPFDPITRQTILPVDADGQPYPLDWVHLTLEQGNTVCVQVRGEGTVIAAMKLDPAYLWLEDQPAIVSEPLLTEAGELLLSEVDELLFTEAVELNKLTTYDFAISQFPLEEVDIKDWTTSQKAKESIIELYGTLEGYNQSRLGESDA